MKKIIVNIGAGYGDEGKGLMTNYFASIYPEALVVRFNGGAQAGHTVIHNGIRHIFSSFGSGTLNSNDTFLDKNVVVNPILFNKEYQELQEKDITPNIFCHTLCPVTLYFDMIKNQDLERTRGINKHGSVGVGFGQTLERIEHSKYDLRVGHLFQTNYKHKIYNIIKNYYSNYIIEDFEEEVLKEIDLFKSRINILEDPYDNYNILIFEGAQGLLLDQYYGHFPYVTRSNCGLKNISNILHKYKHSKIEINYITRSYTTRHGNGPLKNEHKVPKGIKDNTNITNEWQGAFRYAPLDVDLFNMVTDKDFALFSPRSAEKQVVVTHMDQIHSFKQWSNNLDIKYMSFGPTNDDIIKKYE